MQKDSEKGICKICNLPRSSTKSASLTQWIMVCTCDLASDQSEAVDICKNCGKRLSQGRKGSFTQWILRSDLCNCDMPVQMRPHPDSIIPEPPDESVVEESLPDEIWVDQGGFPLERFGPIEILGRSANSTVYLAIDRLLNKRVAVKCLLSLGEDREKILAFQNEARITSKMQHANIASVLDFGITDNATPYMILEYIEGENLRDLLEKQEPGPSIELVIALFNQILDGVIYAHSKEILHRDLKPENILVTEDEQGKKQIKIIDFGVALTQQESTDRENTILMGTPTYMAPDQARGGHYGKRSEVYSLGCILYEMVSGVPPYQAENSLDMLNKHASAPIPLLSEDNLRPGLQDIPEGLPEIAARCIAKQAEDRFENALSLKEALDTLNLTKESFSSPRDSKQPVDAKVAVIGKVTRSAAMIIIFGSLAYLASDLISNRLAESNKPAPAATYKEPALDSITYQEKDEKTGFVLGDDGYVRPEVISNLKDEDLKLLRRIPSPRLSLMHSTINGSGFKYLRGKKIANLRLNFTDITDDSLAYLSSLRGLRILHLSGTAISDQGIKNLDGLELRHLFLYDCSKIDDNAIDLIANQFPDLRKISLASDKITISGLAPLKRLENLTNLNICVQGIDDNTIDSIATLPISNLDLHSAHIGEKGLMKLYKAKNLKSLTIEESDPIPEEAVARVRSTRPALKLVIKNHSKVNDFEKEIDRVLSF